MLEAIEPEGWEKPRGYANGMLAPAGARLLLRPGQHCILHRHGAVPFMARSCCSPSAANFARAGSG